MLLDDFQLASDIAYDVVSSLPNLKGRLCLPESIGGHAPSDSRLGRFLLLLQGKSRRQTTSTVATAKVRTAIGIDNAPIVPKARVVIGGRTTLPPILRIAV